MTAAPDNQPTRLQAVASLPPLHTLDDDVLLDGQTAAVYLDINPQTLHNWRRLAKSPIAYTKVGSHVKYRAGEIKRVVRGGTESVPA